MGRQLVTLDKEAQEILDSLVEIFNSSRSNIIEDLILDYYDDYANSRRAELDAWIEEHGDEDEDEDVDEDEDEEEEEDEE